MHAELTPGDIVQDLLTSLRVGRRLSLIDIDGHVTTRHPDGASVLVTPGPVAGGAFRIGPSDLLRVGLDGAVLEGRPEAVPMGLATDLAILRARPDVRAIAAGAPWTAMALGVVGRQILPLTHTWAELAHEGAAWLDPEAHLTADAGVREADGPVGRVVGGRGHVHVPGVAVLALGTECLDALRRLDALEYLARLTVMATSLAPTPAVVTPEQAAGIPAQRPAERVPSRDFRRFYRSLDTGPLGDGVGSWQPPHDEPAARREVALACRVLAAAGDLVAFFEHVSQRVPGRDDRFAMSPATDFARMTPEDIGILAMDGDCERVSGPLPAAPFRWYHRDLLRARPDVRAIVHTHELAGRAFQLAGVAPQAVHKLAAAGLDGMPPVFPEVSLLFDQGHRERMVEILGDGPWVHAFAHGTDFVAPDLPTATMRAVCWDRHLRFLALARSLGEPRPLGEPVLASLRRRVASPDAWWADAVEMLGIPQAGGH